MGSGLLIRRAVQKYGIENFKKEILEVYETEREMNLAERILVVLDKEVSYNQCPGGQGGWGFINENGLNPRKNSNFQKSICPFGNPDFKERHRDDFRRGTIRRNEIHGKPSNFSFDGHNHREDTKARMSVSHQGKHDGPKNSQFGTCWITDGHSNRKIKVTDLDEWLDRGWTKGRKLN